VSRESRTVREPWETWEPQETRWGPLGSLDRLLVTRDHAGAVAYLVDKLAVAHGRRQRLRHALARSLDLTGMRRLLTPTAPYGELPARFRTALYWLNRVFGPEGEPLLAGPPFDGNRPAGFVLLTDYEGSSRGQAVGFLFADREETPRAVLKLRPDGGPSEPPLVKEATALDELVVLPSSLAATVPRRRAFHRLEGASALLTSVLPGRSAYVELHRGILSGAEAAARHLELAGAWLGRFHRATRQDERWQPPDPDDPRFGPVRGGDGSAPRWLRELTDDLETSPLVSCSGHGDFWARNLLVPPEDSDALPGVVDWGGYQAVAEPYEDLFHFPWTYAGLHPAGRRWSRGVLPTESDPESAFRRVFLEDNALARAVRRYFQLYTQGSGLPWSLLPALFRLFLLTRAAADGEIAGKEGPWLRTYQGFDTAPRSVFSG